MGDLIRKTAKADDIFADIEQTLIAAAAHGGTWDRLAKERLGGAMDMYRQLKTEANEAGVADAASSAALIAADQKADLAIGHVADQLWNAAGRPAFDPALAVVFPGGISTYTDGPKDDQPNRMELLAQLIEKVKLDKVDAGTRASLAKTVRDQAASYRTAVEAARGPRARVRLARKAFTALAHSTQAQLANLKRLFKVEGFTEAEIHTVMPDRPVTTKKAAAPSPTPVAPGSSDEVSANAPPNA